MAKSKMLRMNLLKSRGGANAATAKQFEIDTTIAATASLGSEEGSPKDLIVKVFIMFAAMGLLMLYESYNIDQLKQKLSGLTTQNQNLAAEITRKKPAAEKAKALQKDIQDLEARIQVIKDLAKYRLRFIKALDYIQNIIPDKVWLARITIKEPKDSSTTDLGLNVEGTSLSDDQFNRFLDALASNSLFKNVIPIRAVDQASKQGTFKLFEITSEITAVD